MRARAILWGGLCLSSALFAQAGEPGTRAEGRAAAPLMQLLAEELDYSMAHLVSGESPKPYFLSYSVVDTKTISIWGSLGALHRNEQDRQRALDVDLRVGDYALDNTHQIRGRGDDRRFGRSSGASRSLPIEDDAAAIQHSLWLTTDRAYKAAVDRYQRVKTDLKTTVEEESKVPDFSHEEPSVAAEPDAELTLDREAWAQRIRDVSRDSHQISADLRILGRHRGRGRESIPGHQRRHALKTGSKRLRVVVSASSKAEDGMDLSQSFIFNAASEAGLPDVEKIREPLRK